MPYFWEMATMTLIGNCRRCASEFVQCVVKIETDPRLLGQSDLQAQDVILPMGKKPTANSHLDNVLFAVTEETAHWHISNRRTCFHDSKQGQWRLGVSSPYMAFSWAVDKERQFTNCCSCSSLSSENGTQNLHTCAASGVSLEEGTRLRATGLG